MRSLLRHEYSLLKHARCELRQAGRRLADKVSPDSGPRVINRVNATERIVCEGLKSQISDLVTAGPTHMAHCSQDQNHSCLRFRGEHDAYRIPTIWYRMVQTRIPSNFAHLALPTKGGETSALAGPDPAHPTSRSQQVSMCRSLLKKNTRFNWSLRQGLEPGVGVGGAVPRPHRQAAWTGVIFAMFQAAVLS